MDTIGERLGWARAQAGFKNATDAARHFGWNENTYRSHENGAREPKRSIAKQYAKAFKVSFNWLFLGHGEASDKTDPVDAALMSVISDMDRRRKQKLLKMAYLLEDDDDEAAK